METITNLTTNIAYVATTATQAATEAIYGKTEESKAATTTGNETAGKEPLSGETGDVKSGEPYDKGNDETVLGGTTAKGMFVIFVCVEFESAAESVLLAHVWGRLLLDR